MSENKLMETSNGTYTFDLMGGYKDSDGALHLEVEIREMTGVDEEAIAKGEVRTNTSRIISTLLEGCVLRIGTVERDIVGRTMWAKIIQKLSLGDRDLLMMKIREATYGNELELKIKCPDCKQELTHIMELDEVEIKPLVGDAHVIPFELPKGYRDKDGQVHKNGSLRLPDGFDQEQLEGVARKNPGMANTTLLTRCVTELEGVKLSSNTFRELSQKDREYLIQLLSDNMYGPVLSIESDCPVCGAHFSQGVSPLNFL